MTCRTRLDTFNVGGYLVTLVLIVLGVGWAAVLGYAVYAVVLLTRYMKCRCRRCSR